MVLASSSLKKYLSNWIILFQVEVKIQDPVWNYHLVENGMMWNSIKNQSCEGKTFKEWMEKIKTIGKELVNLLNTR